MISRAESVIAGNRQKKMARFVAKIDANFRDQGRNPESPEVAAEIVTSVESSTIAEWKKLAATLDVHNKRDPWRIDKKEDVPSEVTRVLIVNVYRVRAGMELRTEPWAPPPELCVWGDGRPRYEKHWLDGKVTTLNVCKECDEKEDRETVEQLSHMMSPAGRAEAAKEQREEEQRKRWAR